MKIGSVGWMHTKRMKGNRVKLPFTEVIVIVSRESISPHHRHLSLQICEDFAYVLHIHTAFSSVGGGTSCVGKGKES